MIGILGGTFDPIHYGHLRPALDVLQALELEQIRFIPVHQAVHRKQPATPARLRRAMVEAAIADQAEFTLDPRELERQGDSYTVHTLESLRQDLGETPLCLLLGADAFANFPAWRQPEQILRLAHLVVMQRPGGAAPVPGPLAELVENHRIRDMNQLQGAAAGGILFLDVTQLDISASRIRHLLQTGYSPRFLLPDRVLEIIEREGLYR